MASSEFVAKSAKPKKRCRFLAKGEGFVFPFGFNPEPDCPQS
jgi:hypothetical protein